MNNINKKIKTIEKISYEPEADVLSWEVSKQPIDFAKEIGNFVVHFNKNQTPVLVEILEASKFLMKADNLIGKKKIAMRSELPVLVS
ncbi:MAG: DUF2283 domain-containing protein [Patescibacteria group bacterium]